VLYPYILEALNDRNIAYVHVADYTGERMRSYAPV
jgi:hypothetical protein